MKRFYIVALAILGAVSLQAASITMTIPTATATNLLGNLFQGSAKITSVALTSTNAGSFVAYDSPTNVWTYTTADYTNTVSYGTNYIYSWTNYYGVVNSWTNMTLVDVQNTVAASTNAYPARFALSCLANTTTSINPTSYVFENGVWVTNTSAYTINLTVTYQQ